MAYGLIAEIKFCKAQMRVLAARKKLYDYMRIHQIDEFKPDQRKEAVRLGKLVERAARLEDEAEKLLR